MNVAQQENSPDPANADKEAPPMAENIELRFEDNLAYAPSPLVGFLAGVLLSIALWLLVGCAALIVHLLSGVH